MNLPDLKQLDKLIALCRKRGIKSVQIDNLKIELGDAPEQRSTKKAQAISQVEEDFESDALTDEQLLHWSVTNLPSDTQPKE